MALLCKASCPMHLCRFARGDLVDAAIAPAAVAAAEALADSTAADTERVAKYLERYGAVRDKRAAMQVQLAAYVQTLQTHADQVQKEVIIRSVV